MSKQDLDYITIKGARENNLKDVSVRIPRNELTVVTGISGSGKSSLIFDTLFAEGQRRYMETFDNYSRQFIGKIERPDVDEITGLSPVISIEQKSTGWNPRSTVGTITEVYDFIRLLYARIGEAYSQSTGKRLIQYSEEEIIEDILDRFDQRKIILLAPVVRGRKGHYRELFDQIRKQGYNKVRVDGEILEITKGMQVERFKTHDIEVIIDRIIVEKNKKQRLTESTQSALRQGDGIVYVLDMDTDEIQLYSQNLMDLESGVAIEEPSPNTFSFNSPYGACPACKGIGMRYTVNLETVIPDDSISIAKGGITAIGEMRDNYTFKQLRSIAKFYGFSLTDPVNKIPEEALDLILYGNKKKESSYSGKVEGLIPQLYRWHEETDSKNIQSWAESFMDKVTCDECQGYRLAPNSLSFKLHDKHIGQMAEMDLQQLYEEMVGLPKHLNKKQNLIASELLKEIQTRLQFLLNVGLHYLSLNRPATSLSGGEAQRTRLANQIGSELSGITYILDEPSIGLHQRDNHRLIKALNELVERENTVIVVEHDKDIMIAADYLVDLGPGAGNYGGKIIAEGSPKQFLAEKNSETSLYLTGDKNIVVPSERRKGNGKFLQVKGAHGHNLQNVDLSIPLGTFTVVTGVSGSGKSSLINQTMYPILRRHFYRSKQTPLPYERIDGLDHIDKVIEIDQKPIGRTPRSNPATYTKLYSHIRKLFADVPEAKIRGYSVGRFSFNVKGGRCPECKGAGVQTIEMNFLPDVYVECPVCHGKRYNRETLEIIYKGKNIFDVLEMSVDEAAVFFKNVPKIYKPLKTLQDVGLGYIKLGQSSTTLSGGEAQRVKLAEELSKRSTGNTLYILDEPTTGLHFEDIQKLLQVIQLLVDKGNTFVVIEHNMDVIKSADYIIDIGPEGGRGGGTIVAEGTPEKIAKDKNSLTAKFLKDELST